MHPQLLHSRRSSRSRGFTLVEMLVVVAIIAALMAMLVPAVQSARESARRTNCASNLGQLAKASQTHLTLLGHYPTGGWNDAAVPVPGGGADWRQPAGWSYTILPYMDLQNIYDSVDITIPVPVYACPSRRGTSIGPGSIGVMTDYAGNRGSWATNPASPSRVTQFGAYGIADPSTATASDWANLAASLNAAQTIPGTTVSVPTGGVIFAGSGLLPVRIRDGAANTYLAAEKYVPRLEYNTATNPGYNHSAYVGDSADTLRGGHRPPASDGTTWADGLEGAFGGPHVPGFNAVFCDGSVRILTFAVDPGVHFLLAGREDRQPVQVPD